MTKLLTIPNKSFFRMVDWFIPRHMMAVENQDAGLKRRHRILIGISLIKVVLWLSMAIFLLISPRQQAVFEIVFLYYLALMAVWGIAAPAIFKNTGAYNAIVILDLVLTRVAILLLIFYTGGLASPNMVWLMMGPLVTMIFLGIRSSFIDLFLVVCTIVGIRYLTAEFLFSLPVDELREIQQVDALIGTVFLTLAVLFFETARERTQRRLERAMADIKRVNEQLLTANDKAEAATRAKSEFLANMSHEIRTPLNTVIGGTSLLLEGSLTEDQRELMELVRNGGDALLSLINDILDLSKIEAGRLDLEKEPFNLHQCVEDAVQVMALKAAEKNLEIIPFISESVPRIVHGDGVRLQQVLLNLLGNAVKFTPVGEILLTVKTISADVATPVIHFSVKDTGIGIPPDGVSRLFRTFSQVDSSNTRSYGGTGLGLAISRQLVQLMGGRIWVESEEGIGSDFQFIIEVQEALGQPDPQPLMPLFNARRLLIVDDNETQVTVLQETVAAWGMIADTAVSATDALTLLETESYDGLVIDGHMPEMDGLELAEAISWNSSAPPTPLLLLTAKDIHAGDPRLKFVSEQLRKPIRRQQLQDALSRLLTPSAGAAVEPDPAQQVTDREFGERHPLRILVAEDNPVNQKIIISILQRLGYRADVANNGREVLQMVEQRVYDLVLMDVQMPQMDGLETSRRLAEIVGFGRRPYIIAVTANALQGDRERCLQAGMDDYISKPIRLPELIAALQRCPSPAAELIPLT